MKRIRGLALLGLALTITVLLAACGSSGSGSKGGMDMNGSPSKATGNPTDRAFVAQMVPHHKSAIAMAEIAQKRGQSPFVKTLANNIVRTQGEEIGKMRTADAKLGKAGVKVGDLGMSMSAMSMSTDDSMLKTANPFDRAFIDMMIPHHQGAIRMARMELVKGKDPQLKAIARAVVAAQAKEIGEMNAHRKMAFGARSPAGGVPAAGKMKGM